MTLNKPISCCSGAIRPGKPGSCWSDFTKRELPFALNPEVLLPSPGRLLSSISVWTQPASAKSLRFTAIFLGMDHRIITHLSFLRIATCNQPMKPTPKALPYSLPLIWNLFTSQLTRRYPSRLCLLCRFPQKLHSTSRLSQSMSRASLRLYSRAGWPHCGISWLIHYRSFGLRGLPVHVAASRLAPFSLGQSKWRGFAAK